MYAAHVKKKKKNCFERKNARTIEFVYLSSNFIFSFSFIFFTITKKIIFFLLSTFHTYRGYLHFTFLISFSHIYIHAQIRKFNICNICMSVDEYICIYVYVYVY